MSDLDRATAKREVFEDWLILHAEYPGSEGCSWQFDVLTIAGEAISPVPGTLYETEAGVDTLDVLEAGSFLVGAVKWDGCSDWDFPGVEHCMLHFCGEHSATGLGRLMAKIYEIVRREMPKFDVRLGA